MNNTISLKEIAHARSGDKGTGANVGVIAYTAAGYAFLEQELTSERLTKHLHELHPQGVQRYSLPGIRAYNFVLPSILDGGASRSLRIDSQGKVLALAVLEMQLPRPENLAQMQPKSHQS
ncbi:hypothetical protein Mal52_07600 [Symmachiella dynata]|uniref:AtuA-like ferredoxin-fold domain-containing protein n=1 Tax=Symmachiella dynata TaxID=2527995 RepID=A0A517ZIK6_9PLAN|nr:hypothetical protein [Symmachiella dynata]QDU42304.1 hypothetical protein Mal52_07600 [Symmachiella dynata]